MNESRLRQEAHQFLENIFQQLKSTQIELEPHWDIDHLCYRVSSEENYIKIKNDLSRFAEILIESEVNGRLISTFKLSAPIDFREFKIYLVELPAPKKSKPFQDGFEHFEVVCDMTFDAIQKKYPQAQFDDSGLQKSFNPELEILLNGCAIKFHHMSLESVINYEKTSSV